MMGDRATVPSMPGHTSTRAQILAAKDESNPLERHGQGTEVMARGKVRRVLNNQPDSHSAGSHSRLRSMSSIKRDVKKKSSASALAKGAKQCHTVFISSALSKGRMKNCMPSRSTSGSHTSAQTKKCT